MHSDTNRSRALLPAFAIPVFLIVCGFLSYDSTRPPRALSEDADPALFSASRAVEVLKHVSAQPHPIGSAAHDRIRDLLLDRLRVLTDEASIQRSEMVSDYRRWSSAVAMATVDNLVARVRGRESGEAVLLMAHYDSAPSSPGAADDGTGVASILETLRALRRGPALRNDLIVLLSDGEEAGLLGAQVFFRQHPWRDEVRLVLNLEARGSRGPVILFETSPGNGRLISEFSKSAYRPLANSLAYEAYKRMPNDTDLSIAKRAGCAGLNFAFTEGVYDYHSAGDSLDHLSLASLQQMGDTTLALTRRFGNLDLDDLHAPDSAYFDPIGRRLIRYPLWLHWVLFGVLLLLFVGTVIRGLRAGRISVGSVALGAAAFLVVLILFLEASAVLQGMVHHMAASDGLAAWRMEMNSTSLLVGQFLLGIAVFAFFVEWIHRGVRLLGAIAVPVVLIVGLWSMGVFLWPLVLVATAVGLLLYLAFRHGMPGSRSLEVGTLSIWLLGFALLAALAPGSAFLFGWPLLFALPVYLWEVGRRERERGRDPLAWLVILAGTVPAGILLNEIARMVHVNVGDMVPWIAALPAGFLLGLLFPLFSASERRGRWVLGVVSALLAVTFFATPLLSNFDVRYRRPAELFFLKDQENGSWATTDRHLSPWQKGVMGTPTEASLSRIIPRRHGRLLLSEPRDAAVGAPTVQPTSLVQTDHGEEVEFELHPSPGSARVDLFLSGIRNLRDASVNGMPVTTAGESPETQWWVYTAPPAGGLHIRLEADSLQEASIRVVQVTYGWPAGLRVRPRPPTVMSNPWGIPDSTIVVREWSLGELREHREQ
jgi:hypothetical protein